MSPQFFEDQWKRLQTHFGTKAMNVEFKILVADAIADLTEDSFQKCVTVFIGERPYNKPPRVSDFRQAAVDQSNREFKRDLTTASQFVLKRSPEEMREHLQTVLRGTPSELLKKRTKL